MLDNIRPKWQNTPFLQTFQQNAPCLKLFRDMPLFWNSIFETRFLDNRVIAKWNIKKKKKNCGTWTQVPFKELKFLVRNSSSWNLSSLKIFKWNSSSTFFFFKVSFCYNSIVQKSSFTLKLDFLKIEFQNRDISLNSFKHGHFIRKFVRNG